MPVYKHKKTGKWYWRIRRNGLDLTSPKYFIRKDDCERKERLAQLEIDNGSYNTNSKTEKQINSIDTDIKEHEYRIDKVMLRIDEAMSRIDRLYEMFVDLVKEKK